MTAAEIGAGTGEMTVVVARAVGAAGRMYSTEVDEDDREDIRAALDQAALRNGTVIEAGQTTSNLPESCCDAVFMRRVYHHFTAPASVNRSLFAALKRGGRLAVIDFEPRWYLPTPGGVPEDRGGHGVSQRLLQQELRQAGFEIELSIPNWPGDAFCVIARKP